MKDPRSVCVTLQSSNRWRGGQGVCTTARETEVGGFWGLGACGGTIPAMVANIAEVRRLLGAEFHRGITGDVIHRWVSLTEVREKLGDEITIQVRDDMVIVSFEVGDGPAALVGKVRDDNMLENPVLFHGAVAAVLCSNK